MPPISVNPFSSAPRPAPIASRPASAPRAPYAPPAAPSRPSTIDTDASMLSWVDRASNFAEASGKEYLTELGRVAAEIGDTAPGQLRYIEDLSEGLKARTNTFGVIGNTIDFTTEVAQNGLPKGLVNFGAGLVGSAQGASAGAEMGSVFGPMGALVGGGVGAVVGQEGMKVLSNAAYDSAMGGWSGYWQTAAEGGSLNDATRANAARGAQWLAPGLSIGEHVTGFGTGLVTTWGRDVGAFAAAGADLASGAASAISSGISDAVGWVVSSDGSGTRYLGGTIDMGPDGWQGCGDASTGWLVPDRLGDIDMRPACYDHDVAWSGDPSLNDLLRADASLGADIAFGGEDVGWTERAARLGLGFLYTGATDAVALGSAAASGLGSAWQEASDYLFGTQQPTDSFFAEAPPAGDAFFSPSSFDSFSGSSFDSFADSSSFESFDGGSDYGMDGMDRF